MAHTRVARAVLVAFSAASAAVIAAAAASRPAAADRSLQALISVSSGYTDNVLQVPDNPADPMATGAVSSDAFANVAPGLMFSYQGPRVTQVLIYTLNIRLYAQASEANSFSNTLNYGVAIPLTPRASVGFDLSASHGRLNAFNTAPQNANIGAQAPDAAYVQASAGENYSYELTRSWQFQQSLGSSVYKPTDDSAQNGIRATLDAGLGLSKTFNFNSLTLTGRGTYSYIEQGEDADGNDLENQKTILAGPQLRWVHDLSLDFSTDAMIGATVSMRADDFENREVFPIGSAFLRYTHDRYAAAIGYSRAVATNIIVGDTEATHVVEARGVVPVPVKHKAFLDRLAASGAVGYINGETLRDPNEAGEDINGHTVAWIGDVALLWQTNDAISLSARYQIAWQNRDDPFLLMMEDPERTRRQQFTVILEGRYPTRQAAELPKDSSTRVDKGLEGMSDKQQSLVR